jgi:hypothetical protein
MGHIRKKFKRIYLRIVSAKGASHQVAGGLSLGVFWGCSPLWGLQMILAFISATICNFSRIPAILAVHVSNFVTMPVIYYATWKIGDLMMTPFFGASAQMPLSDTISSFSWGSLLQLTGQALIRMLLNGFVFGGIMATLTYPLSLWGINRFRRAIQARREARRRELLATVAAAETKPLAGSSEATAEQVAEPLERSA